MGSVGQRGFCTEEWDLWGRGEKESCGAEGVLWDRKGTIGQSVFYWTGIQSVVPGFLMGSVGHYGAGSPPLLYPSPLPLFQEFFRGRGGAGESS